MTLRLSDNSLRNLVNTIYRANGKDPYATDAFDSLQTSNGVRDRFGDTYVPASTLKATLEDPNGYTALSLRDDYHPDRAMRLAEDVVAGLDRSDGWSNGSVTVGTTSGRSWGGSYSNPYGGLGSYQAGSYGSTGSYGSYGSYNRGFGSYGSASGSSFGGGTVQLSDQQLAEELASGQLVIARGGRLEDRSTARGYGDTILAVHEDAAGPKLTLDQ